MRLPGDLSRSFARHCPAEPESDIHGCPHSKEHNRPALAQHLAEQSLSRTEARAIHTVDVRGVGPVDAAVERRVARGLAVGVIRATASGAMMHDHAPEQPALDTV